jgi:hypothetical protein
VHAIAVEVVDALKEFLSEIPVDRLQHGETLMLALN